LDDITLLNKIKSKISSINIIVCTDKRNYKYEDLIQRLGFGFKIPSETICDTCRFNNNIKKIISSYLSSKCINGASFYTTKTICLISNDIRNSNLNELSKKIKISDRHLSRIIKKDFHTSFRSLINGLKISITKELIKQYRYSDQQIADFLGYRELNNLLRFIRKSTGKSLNKLKIDLI
jgi:YesN/AraC family two-component response regulator